MATEGNRDQRRSAVIGDLRLTDPDRTGPGSTGSTDRDTADLVDVLFELDVGYPGGLELLTSQFVRLWADPGPGALRALPTRVSDKLYQGVLTRSELAALVEADRTSGGPRIIFKAWPDYVLHPQIDRSAGTVKADAAVRSYRAGGKGIVWAVIDSGIQADHQHFAGLEIATEHLDPTTPASSGRLTGGLHRDFTALVQPSQPGPVAPGQPPSDPLIDELGHGSHVAGIIAGRSPEKVAAVVASSDELPSGDGFVSRRPTGALAGMAPECELVSLKIMRMDRRGNWITSSAAVIAALEYIRTQVNLSRFAMRIHGVNLSLGCDWDPTHYAAGQSPLCQAVNELVASGVVVVISSGNGGSTLAPDNANQKITLMGSVTEPGHADACITVGSTHRDAPMTFGVSWTSGKGPTLDGRCKPDLVAPGEWITSVAVGLVRSSAGLTAAGMDPSVTYAPQSGTSMAAPHVSGVIAGFLAARPEFIGRPEQVKQMLCASATDLGRERYAQGCGLVDAMRLHSNY